MLEQNLFLNGFMGIPEEEEPEKKDTFTKQDFDRASVAALQDLANDKDLNGEAKMALSLASVVYLVHLKKNLFGEEKA